MSMILLTGGTGYIGSHAAVELLNRGDEVILVDDLSNSRADVVDRLEQITNRRPVFYQANVADNAAMEEVFSRNAFDAVVHFAGFKAVGESVCQPIAYYRNNLDSTLTMSEVMAAHGVKRIVFSASATVYGADALSPYREEMPTGNCTNPYGWTKHMIEQILRSAANADPALSVVPLRYFNPIGAHESGLIGEARNGIPNNLMPYITQVAAGELPQLSVFGNDYPTPDGTCIRDYIHVSDLAAGHAAALEYVMTHTGAEAFNLGTGRGYSVLEVVHAFERASGVPVPFRFAPPQGGRSPCVLCRSLQSGAAAGLADKALAGGYVPGFLALAAALSKQRPPIKGAYRLCVC